MKTYRLLPLFLLAASPLWAQEIILTPIPETTPTPAVETKPVEPPAELAPSAWFERGTLDAEETQIRSRLDAAGLRAVPSRSRLQISPQFVDLSGKPRANRFVFGGDVAFLDDFIARVELPIIQYDVNDGVTPRKSGLGDLLFRLGARVYRGPRLSASFFLDTQFDTSTSVLLGTGKTVLAPGIELSTPIVPARSLLSVSLQQFKSVAGSAARASVNYLATRLAFDTEYKNRWTTSLEPVFFFDWTGGKDAGGLVEVEVLRKVGDHFRLFLRGGAGMFGKAIAQVYDWSAQGGARYLF